MSDVMSAVPLKVPVTNLFCAFACVHQDIPTGADSCVTSLSCDSQRSLIAAGLGDGSVRVFDRRMGPNEW